MESIPREEGSFGMDLCTKVREDWDKKRNMSCRKTVQFLPILLFIEVCNRKVTTKVQLSFEDLIYRV